MNNNISSLLKKPWVIPASVGIVTFSGGIGLGYILGVRRAVKVFFEAHDYDEIDVMEMSVDGVERLIEDMQSATDTIEEATRIIETINDESEEFAPIMESIFAAATDDWDYEAELSTRTQEAPYVLHVDEFMSDEMGLHQSTLTYYSGDNILVDENDVPIYNYAETVGEMKFGHGSKDKNVVYIRNERLHGEYEILFSQGYYSVEVLGLEIEKDLSSEDLRHSTRKFRMD